jgi:hypothetical protein
VDHATHSGWAQVEASAEAPPDPTLDTGCRAAHHRDRCRRREPLAGRLGDRRRISFGPVFILFAVPTACTLPARIRHPAARVPAAVAGQTLPKRQAAE